jgi:hypothetical protein
MSERIVQQKWWSTLDGCEQSCDLDALYEEQLILRGPTQLIGGLHLTCLWHDHLHAEVTIHHRVCVTPVRDASD